MRISAVAKFQRLQTGIQSTLRLVSILQKRRIVALASFGSYIGVDNDQRIGGAL
ncbi:MAG: hypothetical protein ISS63_15650 [Desulfobacteraceae bacterium]|nr:hypothetical protein [Desulfobacteraceae bacterium]